MTSALFCSSDTSPFIFNILLCHIKVPNVHDIGAFRITTVIAIWSSTFIPVTIDGIQHDAGIRAGCVLFVEFQKTCEETNGLKFGAILDG